MGTLLGAVSRYSLYHVDINTDLCTGCNLCVKRCKASCINPADHTVDLSRCVVCFDCTAACPSDAITFRRGRHQLKMPLLRPTVSSAASPMSGPQAASSATRPLSRREFLASLTAAGCVSVMASAPEEALAPVNYPVPPGAVPDGAFEARCTGCGACVAACPTGAVHPATDELGWRNALHPYLDFNSGPCRYDCTACTHVCPSGAIEPLTAGAKHRFVIGKARVDARLCLMYEFGSSCGLCARRCPVQAVAIVTEVNGRRVPHVSFDACIGCGECQWVCPASPKAIVVEGI